MPRINSKKQFTSHDGFNITYRYFPAEPTSRDEEAGNPVVVLFHRESDLVCNTADYVENLVVLNCGFFSLDLDESNITVGKQNKSLTSSKQAYYFQQFIEHIKEEHNICEQDVAVISHSDRAAIITTWIIDYAPIIRSAVYYAPLFLFSKRNASWLWLKNVVYKVRKKKLGSTNSFESGGVNSHPFKENRSLANCFSWRYFSELVYTGRRILRSAFSYSIPTLIIINSAEKYHNSASQLSFYANIASDKKELHILPGYSPVNQCGGALPIITDFIASHFREIHNIPSLFNSHEQGITKAEYEKLRLPEKNRLKRLYWGLQRLGLKHVGKLSTGIKLGLKTGFDSGASLDYIYKNEPSGENQLGKLIDRYYLENIGWRCTRMRKAHVEELILLASERLGREHQKIKLLDIAAGHGSYIINTLEKIAQPIEHVLMRDFELSNVQRGNTLIEEHQLGSRATFEQGDAFSLEDLSTLPTDRTLTIVSGFYELFSDNNLVLTSLKGVANATQVGGYLVYTTKLWNPKLEYMARVLLSHKQGEQWLLRRRTQLEIDQLVNQAGFVKITQRMDPWGLFSVTLAKKVIA